jgi:hypothetical protein
LEEINENTRYGRTIVPLLKLHDQKETIFMHSYFVVKRFDTENYVSIIWETIDSDELYPVEVSDHVIRTDEVGSMTLHTETLPNGQVQTIFRTVIHSTPPVSAIAEPRGKLSEAFLTAFCRSAEVLESSARKVLLKSLNHDFSSFESSPFFEQ